MVGLEILGLVHIDREAYRVRQSSDGIIEACIGDLLYILREHSRFDIPRNFIRHLKKANIQRNMLAHRFFIHHGRDLVTESGCVRIARKLFHTYEHLVRVDAMLELKDQHVKQAVDYAANQGVDWVVLTNGVRWRVYNVTFAKPIDQELIIEIDFCALNPRSQIDLESLYLLCKEGWIKSVLGDYQLQKQALSRFFLGALVLDEPVLNVIRRELRRVSPDVRIEVDRIKTVLSNEVLKREVIDGEKAEEARKKIARSASKSLRRTDKSHGGQSPDIIVPPTTPAA